MSNARRWVRASALTAAAFAVLLVCAPGCRGTKPTDLPTSVLAHKWMEPGIGSDAYLELDKAMVDGLAARLSKNGQTAPAQPGRPLNLLALSAGGKFGAYTAGVLAGWQAHGTRPAEFDVVTGVSSGAIIALYAFIGPQYDGKVKEFFTETTGRDLFKWRPVRDMIRFGSLGTAEPLMRIIDREINHCVIDEIRAGHCNGRRLYIATLNSQSKRPVIWDVGAVACSGRPDADDLVRKIILAACSIPGMTPPVEFDVEVDGCHYKEKHSDGGAGTQIYMELAQHQARVIPGTRWLDGSRMFIIAAGKFYADPLKAQMNMLDRLGASVSASLYSLYRAELCKLYALSLSSGLDYNIIALDPAVMTKPKSTSFDPADMKILFEAGFQQSCGGVPWRKIPPGGLSGEEETPRGGTCFLTVPRPGASAPVVSIPR